MKGPGQGGDDPRFPPGFILGAATSAYEVEGACSEDGRAFLAVSSSNCSEQYLPYGTTRDEFGTVPTGYYDKGNFGVLAGGGEGGKLAAGVSVGGFMLYVSDAPTVDRLSRYQGQIGGQLREGLAAGAEIVAFSDSQSGQVFKGVNAHRVASPYGPWPFELHATAEHDWLFWRDDIPDLVQSMLGGALR